MAMPIAVYRNMVKKRNEKKIENRMNKKSSATHVSIQILVLRNAYGRFPNINYISR